MSKIILVLVAALVAASESKDLFRYKREAYRFTDGIEFLMPQVQQVFSCEGRIYGYYADVANNCQIFHVCAPPEGQYSFFCPNQTIFDQRYMVCSDPSDAVPCNEAENYYALNQNFGVLELDKLLQF